VDDRNRVRALLALALIALVLLGVAPSVMAAAPVTKARVAGAPGGVLYWGATASAACSAFFTGWRTPATGRNYAGTHPAVVSPPTGFACMETWESNGVQFGPSQVGTGGWAPRCHDNSAPDTSKPLEQQCPDPCTAGTVVGSGYFAIGTSSSASPILLACDGQCESVFDGTSPAGSSLSGGVKTWYAKGQYVSTGAQCSVQKLPGSSTATLPEDTCAAGQVKGTINDKVVCVNQGTGDPAPDSLEKDTTTETTTNPDGSKTEKETTTTTNPDGSTTTRTTTTTKDPNGVVTGTTVTTTTGPPGKDDGESREPTECELNPNADICTGSGSSNRAPGSPDKSAKLHTKDETRTVATVLGGHRDAFLASGLGAAVGGFFTVGGAGSCPTWSAAVPFLNTTITFNQLCTGMGETILTVLRACILLVAAFFSFRIAVE
jgi:hypothetical protein